MPEVEEVVEPVEGAEPTVVEAETEFTLPEDFADTVKGFGIPIEQLPTAVEAYKRLQTDDGVIDAFIQTGQALGFGLRELEGLFQEPTPAAPAAPVAPVEQADPDALMTRAEFEQLLSEKVLNPLEHARQQDEQRRQQERSQAAVSTINGWFDQAGVTDPADRQAVALIASNLVPAGADDYDPRVLVPALEQARTQHEAQIEKAAKAYLAKKAQSAGAQPTPVGAGGTAGGEGDDRPDYAKAGRNAFELAKQRVRDRMRQGGELS